jgi:hypothetical protein
VAGAPDLTLSVFRIALGSVDRAYPLRRDWVTKETMTSVSSAQSETLPETRWRKVGDADKVSVFENQHVLPRAWLVSGELVATSAEALAIIRSGSTASGQRWDPLAQALVEQPTGIGYGNGLERGKTEVTRLEPNRLDVKTESATPALLVLSENHYPGWRAYVDGQSVEVRRVNYNQRGVAVAAGSHVVSFRYRPKSVIIGLVVSLLTLVALVWWSRK